MENIKFIFEYLKGQGFSKKGTTLWKSESHGTIFMNIQRSRYDKGYYLNFGVKYNYISNSPSRSLLPIQWDIFFRYQGYIESAKQTDNLTCIRDVLTSLDEKEILNNLNNEILPFLNGMLDKQYAANVEPTLLESKRIDYSTLAVRKFINNDDWGKTRT